MKKAFSAAILIIVMIMTTSCTTIAPLATAVCQTLVGGSKMEVACDKVYEYIMPEEEEEGTS